MMSPDDRYEQWKQWRADVALAGDFADRIMKAVHAEQDRHTALVGWLILVLSSRLGRISVGVLAALVCVVRIIAVVALFLFPS